MLEYFIDTRWRVFMFFTWRDFAISQLVLWVGFKTNDQSSLQNHFGTKSRDESWRSDGVTAAQRNQFFWIDTLVYFTFFQRLSADPLSTFSQHKMTTKLSFSNSLHSPPPLSLSLNVDFSTRESFKHTFTHMVPVAKKRVAISRHLSLSLSLSCSLTL